MNGRALRRNGDSLGVRFGECVQPQSKDGPRRKARFWFEAERPKRFLAARACDPYEPENLRARTCTDHYARATVVVPRDAESLNIADRDYGRD
jgi:hypothetical protein